MNTQEKKWTVLISSPYMRLSIDRFKAEFQSRGIKLLLPTVHERLTEAELLEFIADVDGVICGDDRFTETVLKRARKLKVISKWGTGTDSIDREACSRLGIEIKNTPGAFTEPVADSVLGYILCFSRQLISMSSDMHRGVWNKVPGRSLSECILGIIGVGDIGKAVAQRAKAFGMKTLGNDPRPMSKAQKDELSIEMVNLDELLRMSDFISLNCDLNPTSSGLIGLNEFDKMKNTAYLINTARGGVIQEKPLIQTLEKGRIAGAALDVFENEPLLENCPLRGMQNVIMAPHNANSSPKAWERVHRNSIKNLFDVLQNS